MTTIDDLTLDGMPEPPPAWARPAEAVRMPALDLDQVLAAAFPHIGTDEDLPALTALRLTVADGLLVTTATDRYTAVRENRPIMQTCPDFHFHLRRDDVHLLRQGLKNVLRGLKDDARDVEPVDLALEATDDGPALRVLGDGLDVRFTEHDEAHGFPDVSLLIDGVLARLSAQPRATFDALINPTYLARAVALQRAGRAHAVLRFASAAAPPGRLEPVIVTPADDEDDVVMVVMPARAEADEQ